MLKCLRCDRTWHQKSADKKPKTCPFCKSKVWNKPLDQYWQARKEKMQAMKKALEEVKNG